jgi:dihydroflavonol-4-reductase
MKALVTGASGFIGSHLAEHLRDRGYEVRCLIRKSSSREWLGGFDQLVFGDVFDKNALHEAVAGVDIVFHSAGLTKAKTPDEYFRANVEGTKNLLKAVRSANPGLRRFVLLSSQTAAGPSPTKTPIAEDFPPHPITTYGRSKLQAEKEVMACAQDLPVTIVRPPAVYGPRDKDIFEFFSTMSRHLQPMVGFQERFVSLIHARDLVRGIVMAAESQTSAGQTYFISSRRMYDWREVGDVSRRILDTWALRLKIPEAGVYGIAAVAEVLAKFSSKPALINFEKARDMVQYYWTCDGAKAKRDFGFEEELTLEEGVRDTVGWYRKQGWL